MNKIARFLCAGVLLVSTVDANAQSRKRDDDNIEAWSNRFDSEIERLVDRVTRQFSRLDDNEDQNVSVFDDDTLNLERKHSRRAELGDDDVSFSYTGNKTVGRGETLTGNVIVKGGDLTVKGTIEGDVMVVGGTLYVEGDGHVTGNARVINGSIEKEDGGRIDGYEDRTNTSTADYRESRRQFTGSGTSFNVPWLTEQTNLDNFIFRFNRVESGFIGFGTEKKYYWDGRRSWNSFGSVGWGFRSHTWRYNLGIARQFAFSDESLNQIFEIGAEGYSLTDSKDQWVISTHENTAAALFIHEDFRDYFERRGGTFHAAYYTQGDYVNTELKVAYVMDRYASMSNKIDWAFFGGAKTFRPNPAIAEGNMKSVVASFGLTTMTKTSRGPEGWNLYTTAEFARKDLGKTNFNFDQYVIDVRRYQPLGQYDNINLRVRAGTSTGLVPLQKAFELGGLGSLHALKYKSSIGNRMLLINAEYIVNGNFLDDLDFWPTWLFRSFNFIVMSDAGILRSEVPSAKPLEGFKGIGWGEFSHNLGFGISNRSGSTRIGASWRTDIKEPARLFFRFTRPF